ncbi:hypothetical protein FRC06_000065 [Ceratobasidium sp. 370]|nr:hypothetical protein FRC06_000065 [Ceratobasidium sp. 370]
MSNVLRTRSNRALASLFFVVSRAVHASPLFARTASEGPEEPVGSTRFWWKMIVSLGLVLLGGAFAGLTLGLMGLDELHLRVLAASSDNPKEKMNAQKVLRLMKKGRHWVLVVLLLGNVVVNESLPIFLDSAIGGGIAAVVISTISILNGVLSLNEKKVSQIMTPMEDVVTLGSDTILDHQSVDAILSSGYSRFPVHEPGKPTSFIGLLLIKKLLVYDPSQQLPVSAFSLSILPEAKPSISCFQALDYFQTGRSHLLLISTDPGQPHGALGVITLEDIIEEIISEEIVDETDRYEDNRHKQRAKRQSTAAIMRGIVEREKRRWSFSDTAPGAETPQTGSRAPTPKPTPGKEPMEISRLVPIDEHPANGQHNGLSNYGSINHPSSSHMNGAPETERGRQLNGSTHAGSYTSSPTRI